MKQRQQIGLGVGLAVVAVIVVSLLITGGNKTSTDTSGDTAAKSSSSSDTGSATTTNTVNISNYMFGPMAIKVKVGTKVTWTNQDAVNHTVTADKLMAGAPSSMDIPQHGTYSFAFSKAGTYTYHCFPHPYMHGTVIVTD